MVGALIALALPSFAADGTPGRNQEADVLSKVNGEAITLKDFDLALFWNERPIVQKEIMDFLIQERVVRQEVSRKGVSVKAAEVDEFAADTDRQLRSTEKKSLLEVLAARGADLSLFKRTAELTIGLCLLAGGKGRLAETQTPDVKAKMGELLATLLSSAKIETDPDKLEAGVAATINGERLMIEEVGRTARGMLDQETKMKNLGYLQAFVMVRQEMGRRKLELAPADLDYQVELLCAQRTSDIGEKNVSMTDVLKSLGREPKVLRRQSDFQARAMLTRLVKAETTDEDVRRLFASDPARFGEGVPKASHIMFKTVDARGRPFSSADDLKVRAKALALREKLLAGEDFAAMAGKYSEDKDTAERGGMLGFLDKARIVDPVVAAAYGLKIGEISQPVKGTSGWHLVKVMEIKHVAFEGVKSEVRTRLLAERSSQLLRELNKKAQIEAGPAKL